MLLAGYLIVAHNDHDTWRRASLANAQELGTKSQDLAAYTWISRHASKDTVVLAWQDAVVFLYTGVVASRGLFLSVTNVNVRILVQSLSSLPSTYHKGLLLLLNSDLRPDQRGGELKRVALPNLADSKLEYQGDGALIYSLPIVR